MVDEDDKNAIFAGQEAHEDDDAMGGAASATPDVTPVIAGFAMPFSSESTEPISRDEAAEIMGIAAQAARLGVKIDASAAILGGIRPEALKAAVLEAAADRDATTTISPHHVPPPVPGYRGAAPASGRVSVAAAARKQVEKMLKGSKP